MSRLIWVFAGRTCHFVGFVMGRLIYGKGSTDTIRIIITLWILSMRKSRQFTHKLSKASSLEFTHYLNPQNDNPFLIIPNLSEKYYRWAASSEFGTYRLCEQRRFRRACASAQSRQNLRYSLIQAVSQEEPSDRKPDPWPLWMAGHAQLKFVMTECSKTQICLTRPKY